MRNLTGRVFARWTVHEFAWFDAHGRDIWVCSCICGRWRPVAGAYLVGGRSRSCGCSRRKPQGPRLDTTRYSDLLGQRFGRLTVTMFGLISPDRAAHWLCRCDCGNYRVIASRSMSFTVMNRAQ